MHGLLIIEAENLYEKAYEIFERLRNALCLNSKGESPLFEEYTINMAESKQLKNNTEELSAQFKEELIICEDEKEKRLYTIVIKYIEKYKERLFNNTQLINSHIIRTTNSLEQTWGKRKHSIRQIKGHKQLTREFNSLPSEYMLITNLENPIYIKEMIGDMKNLPEKLAQAAKTAGTYSN